MSALPVNPQHTALIREAMHGVTKEGTSTRVFVGATYLSGGKTGTAQAVTLRQNEKYNASKLEDYQRDHSLYEAFAPVEQPRVALAVIVENAGFGAQSAAPIARRVLDYLISGIYPSEEDIVEVSQGRGIAPIGISRKVSEVPLPRGLDAFGTDVAEPTLPGAAASAVGAVALASSAAASSAPASAPAALAASAAASASMVASAPVAAPSQAPKPAPEQPASPRPAIAALPASRPSGVRP
jgi:penicillin-binding protein 2